MTAQSWDKTSLVAVIFYELDDDHQRKLKNEKVSSKFNAIRGKYRQHKLHDKKTSWEKYPDLYKQLRIFYNFFKLSCSVDRKFGQIEYFCIPQSIYYESGIQWIYIIITSKINDTPQRCSLAHFEDALDFSRSEFTCP